MRGSGKPRHEKGTVTDKYVYHTPDGTAIRNFIVPFSYVLLVVVVLPLHSPLPMMERKMMWRMWSG